MTQQIIQNGNRAVVITQQGNAFSTRLYVGAGNGLANASATPLCRNLKTLKGALNWANAQVAA